MQHAVRKILVQVPALTLALAALAAPAASQSWFTQVTSQAGLGGLIGFRLSVADVNGDGYPDILAHLPQNDTTGDVLNKQILYLNTLDLANPPARRFVDFTATSKIRANRQGTTAGRHSDAGIFADVDNDGDLDLFTGVYVHNNTTLDQGRNDLLLNDSTGRFRLAPSSPFHTEPIHNTAAEVFLDYNNDGNVDLFIGNWYRPNTLTLTADQLYRGNGNGTFTNVTSASGIGSATTAVYAVAAFDADGDGWTDLFAPSYSHVVAGSVPRQWRNNGNGTFTQVQSSTNYDDFRGSGTGKASFGTMPRDYDGDGAPDFIEVIDHGTGDGASGVHSTVVTNLGGFWSWDFSRVSGRGANDNDLSHHGDHYASWLDYDNDGFVDFVLTECCYAAPGGGQNNRIYLFKQNTNRTFSNVTSSSGLGAINTQGAPVHNVLPLDYDLDGDEDLLVGFASSTVGVQLWRNDVGTQNRWIVINLAGAGGAGRANRSAIGAEVEITAGGLTQTREAGAGNGHQGPQTPLSLAFGLGSATTVDHIRVRWPNQAQTVTDLYNVTSNRFLNIQEVPAVPACGEAQCAPVTQAYISHFTGPDCTGEEYYYTPYFGSDGVRRSWDGQGLVGTTLHTVTNRSWRYHVDGRCYNDWPTGNTLSGFVRIYREGGCAEARCAPITGAYISHFTGLDCTGEEHYYTAYNGYDGIRRSWDGQGVAGTTLRTVTNRSWRYSVDGQCRNDWPNGNTLSDFVRIYRGN